ncbi:hypothetical protein WA026_022518 [Henosepilachna vigintioctopunctata]|uniref:Cerebellar degeneration-related protein 2-like n=1 Tax=Henosepilachna vigintioctopunctata TaxID=420089 RepID=A0AAW1UQI0_9CUCU
MCDEESTSSLSLECWDYSVELEYLQGNQDLQLAAELGKTLLERNKELENALKHSQSTVEDQLLEIEYLSKQSAALREVNDSRLRIYEQLEVSIHELEHANHRLVLENAAEKKHVKSLGLTIDSLETKNEELLSTIDDLRLQIDILKKKLRRSSETVTPLASPNVVVLRHVADDIRSTQSSISESSTPLKNNGATSKPNSENKTDNAASSFVDEFLLPDDDCQNSDNIEEISTLLGQLRESKTQCAKEQRKVTELEEQLRTITQQNESLENQIIKLHHKDEEVKSVQEELSLLEEVRNGQTCSRCLRNMESPERQREDTDKASECTQNLPEDDDSSILDELMTASPRFVSAYSINVQDYPKTPQNNKKSKNHYKEFVEKYEALFEDHPQKNPPKEQFASLQEELRNTGEFVFSQRDQDEESGHEDGHSDKQINRNKSGKVVSHTPTDFSEAETSSSGFADETSTKSTQTDGVVGSLLCAISDGDDCKFSIYDEASPIDSRFHKSPEYRELFKEIFTVLKKAAENKEEVLTTPIEPESNNSSMCTAPSEAQMNESITDFQDDDTESMQSSTLSMPVSVSQQTSVIEDIIQTQNEVPQSETPTPVALEEQKPQEPVLRPLIRQSFDFLQVEQRKRSSSRRKHKNVERSDSPMTHIIGSPKISYSSRPNSARRKRELKNTPPQTTEPPEMAWNGNSLQFWSSNRANVSSPTPSQFSEKGMYEFKPSVASQEIRRLKNLDKSYAEVLKLSEGRKREHQRHRANKGTSQHR